MSERRLPQDQREADVMESMPCALEAEEAALGTFVESGADFMTEQRSTWSAEWFYSPANRLFYESLLQMHDANLPINLVTVSQYLLDRGILGKVGGASRPADCVAASGFGVGFEEYKRMLRDRWLLRQVIVVSREAIQKAMSQTAADDPAVVAQVAESQMFDLVSSTQSSGQYSKGCVSSEVAIDQWVEHLEQAIKSRGRITGITTGLHDLDRTLHGLNDAEGEILTLAGRPAMGKTAAVTSIIEHLATHEKLHYGERVKDPVPGVVFSAEMSLNQLLDRVVLGGLRVDTSKALTGFFNRGEQRAIMDRCTELQKAPIFWSDSSYITTGDLRAQVQVLKRKHDIRWMVVDHLHLIKPVGEAAMKDERLRLVEVMETLQFIKKQHKVAVFLLVQMNRESDRNAGKLPVLADLQGSAAIEQYSDHVVFIHRPVYYKPWHKLSEDEQKRWVNGNLEQRRRNPGCWSDGAKYADEMDDGYARQDYEEHALLVVRKNRRGPSPEIAVRFEGEFTRFSSRTPALFSNNKADRQIEESE